MMKIIYILFQLLLVSGLFISTGCSDSDIESGGDTDNTLTGVFTDSVVSGINYSTETLSGTTNSEGEFNFIAGESIIFMIGDIDLPTTLASAIITPLDLADTLDITDAVVVNISQLLQSLDVDGDPTNGIEITQETHSAATGMSSLSFSSLSFDTDVINLVANSGSINTVLVDEETAINHLSDTLIAQGEIVTINSIDFNTGSSALLSLHWMQLPTNGTLAFSSKQNVAELGTSSVVITTLIFNGVPAIKYTTSSTTDPSSYVSILAIAINGDLYNLKSSEISADGFELGSSEAAEILFSATQQDYEPLLTSPSGFTNCVRLIDSGSDWAWVSYVQIGNGVVEEFESDLQTYLPTADTTDEWYVRNDL